jgi:hypothetical protein
LLASDGGREPVRRVDNSFALIFALIDDDLGILPDTVMTTPQNLIGNLGGVMASGVSMQVTETSTDCVRRGLPSIASLLGVFIKYAERLHGRAIVTIVLDSMPGLAATLGISISAYEPTAGTWFLQRYRFACDNLTGVARRRRRVVFILARGEKKQ